MNKKFIQLFIKDELSVHRMFYIERRKNMLVGWMTPVGLFNADLGLPETSRPDIHFTYPASGDYHFSYKPKSKKSGTNDAIRVFHDRVIQKTVTPSLTWKTTHERPENDGRWSQMVPRFRPPSFSEFEAGEKSFAFPAVGFSVGKGRILASAFSRLPSYSKRMNDEEIVDVSGLGSGTLNIIVSLCGKGCVSPWDSAPDKIWSMNDESAYPHIDISVLFMPT